MTRPIHALTAAIGRLKDIWRFGQRAPEGRIAIPEPSIDSFRAYVADGLTPAKVKNLIRAVDGGDLATTLALYEEIEALDLHLQGVANTRRNKLTGLEWDVISVADGFKNEADKEQADREADFGREELANLEGFEEALEHLATAIGPNVAVLELVWERDRLIDIMPIGSHRLRVDIKNPQQVLVVTKDNRIGIAALPPKFVVHIPNNRAGFPFFRTISQATAMIFLIKMLSVADWGGYVELFGIPFRWANWAQNATKEQKQELLDMLKSMGSSAYGAFSPGTNLQFIESSQRGQSPHKDLVEWCARQQSIGWLGQHMTTDTTGATGTQATAKVQDEVRKDLLEDDIKREARTIRRRIIAPMVAFQFPDTRRFRSTSTTPKFERRFREEVDRSVEADVVLKWQRGGVKVPRDWAHKRSEIPKPDGKEEVLEPSIDAFGEGLNEGVTAGAVE